MKGSGDVVKTGIGQGRRVSSKLGKSKKFASRGIGVIYKCNL